MAAGALRAAIRAGNWAQAAMQSRRQARALADMNARGGIRSTGIRENVSPEMLFDRGYRYGVVPPSRMEMAGLPLENNGLPFAYTTRSMPPSGRMNYVNPETGARATFAPNVGLPRYGSPIEAPYEGVRVWGGRTNDGFPRSFDAPPPWLGRGPAPATRRTTMYDPYYGDEFPSAFPRSRYDEPFPMFEPLPFARPSDPNIQYGGNLPYSSFFYGTGY